MCGINGVITAKPEIKSKISKANNLLKHRGPDDEGYVIINPKSNEFTQYSGNDTINQLKNIYPTLHNIHNTNEEVIFAHRRLSIIDLSPAGHCPMCDVNKKVWITYNGEIYNYIELRSELQAAGFNFKSNTDTEVILNAYLHWGTNCLNKFNGMWAFAIWDLRNNSLFAARDRFGVKPFYFVHSNDYFAFSSEIKPLAIYINNALNINDEKIPFFLLYGNRLNSPDTYFSNISQLEPSSYLIYRNGVINISKYYDIPVIINNQSQEEVTEQILFLLKDSIKIRFRSDVPVGTCLSGGFDSSAITALSSVIGKNNIQTFSAVWNEPECDESFYIDIINKKYSCIENKIIPKDYEFEKVFNDISYYLEIPTEGPGLYPQWYVMNLAKQKVKVLLDGQGGDEVFGGYFLEGAYLRGLIKDKKLISLIKNSKLFLKFLNKYGLHSFSSWLFPKQYNLFVRRKSAKKFKILNQELLNNIASDKLFYDSEPPEKFNNYLSNLSYHFIRNLTIPTLLHYEDRTSMAHSIESREPFLDYRLAEFGINLQSEYLSNKGISRPAYRKALEKYLPPEITNRKDKLGYPVPFEKWTKTVLKSYITDTLLANSSLIYKYINKSFLQNQLSEHYSNKKDYSWEIWRYLSLNNFLKLFNEFK